MTQTPPEGYVLVPIEPTNEMLRQAFPEIPDHGIYMGYVRDKYQKMISSAPQPLSEQPIQGLAMALNVVANKLDTDEMFLEIRHIKHELLILIRAARRDLARGG